MEFGLGVIWPAAVAFGLPLAVTPLVRILALRAGAVDRPGERKVHSQPVPCWGGLGICLGFAAAVLLSVPLSKEVMGLLLGGLIALGVGMVDDWRELSPWVKLAGQAAAALVAVAFGISIDFVTNPFGGIIGLGYLSVPVTVLWIVAITNAINLVDGLDGLAAGVSAISAGTIAVVSLGEREPLIAFMAALLAAASLGFLPHNFRGRIFMKDAGSLFLGFMLASLSALGLTKSATAFSLILPILILGIPIFDMLFAIARRALQRRPIFSPDRGHLHHRLLDLGLTQRQAVLLLYAVNLLLGGSAVLLTYLTTEQGLVLLLLLLTAVLVAANKVGLLGPEGVARGRREDLRPQRMHGGSGKGLGA